MLSSPRPSSQYVVSASIFIRGVNVGPCIQQQWAAISVKEDLINNFEGYI
jgi:hypothetical protein